MTTEDNPAVPSRRRSRKPASPSAEGRPGSSVPPTGTPGTDSTPAAAADAAPARRPRAAATAATTGAGAAPPTTAPPASARPTTAGRTTAAPATESRGTAAEPGQPGDAPTAANPAAAELATAEPAAADPVGGGGTAVADAPPGEPTPEEWERLRGGAHHNPHSLLGPHDGPDGATVRVFRPEATAVSVLVQGSEIALQPQGDGLFSGAVGSGGIPSYRLRVTYPHGTYDSDDPYRWLPTLGDIDLHLIGEGRHERLWTVLGAHVRSYDTVDGTVTGTSFAVWAPNARGVRVVGDFSFWDGRAYPLRSLGSSGVWELFVPDVGVGARYKFEILGADGQWRQKADPMARQCEVPPRNASVVTASQYQWSDASWLDRRRDTAAHAAPMSVYEVHLGSWRQGLSYRDLAADLVDYVTGLGFTHVEFMPVAEHPFGGSWGYQVTSYYAPTSRFGDPDDFRALVDALHAAGIGVIVDWVPAHFPKDEWALARFDGTPLYEHADPRRGEQLDWGTYVFNFGRREVRNFLVANALYWLEEFHIDGLRVDAVASMLYLDYSRPDGGWLPNEFGGRENLEAVSFLQEVNATVYREHPGATMIAEESTAWPGVSRPTHLGGLGFGFKWNMGWMHDSLGYLERSPIYRTYHHHQMTFSLMYAWTENFVLPLSHDEVVYGKGSLLTKMPGDRWQQLANLRAYLAFMWAHPGKQLLFMGGELAQEAEWDHDSSLQWWLLDNPDHRGVQSLVRDLNTVYRATAALWARDTDPGGFSWVDANDADSNVFSFVRHDTRGEDLVCVANFAGVPHVGYRLGLPSGGTWREVINTDADVYRGSGVGNGGRVTAEDQPHHGQPASVRLTLPPLGTLWLAREPD